MGKQHSVVTIMLYIKFSELNNSQNQNIYQFRNSNLSIIWNNQVRFFCNEHKDSDGCGPGRWYKHVFRIHKDLKTDANNFVVTQKMIGVKQSDSTFLESFDNTGRLEKPGKYLNSDNIQIIFNQVNDVTVEVKHIRFFLGQNFGENFEEISPLWSYPLDRKMEVPLI